jgi:hypothetical protein
MSVREKSKQAHLPWKTRQKQNLLGGKSLHKRGNFWCPFLWKGSAIKVYGGKRKRDVNFNSSLRLIVQQE